MVCFIIRFSVYGMWGLCFVMKNYKRVVIVSFIRLVWKYLVWVVWILMLN